MITLRQLWHCTTCKAQSYIRYAGDADILTIVHLILVDHSRLSPACKVESWKDIYAKIQAPRTPIFAPRHHGHCSCGEWTKPGEVLCIFCQIDKERK